MKITWQYLAGFTDGEGTIRVPSTSKSITANFSLVQSGKEGLAVLSEIKEFLSAHGIDSALLYTPRHKSNPKVQSKKPMFYLGVYRREHVEYIIRNLVPFLRVKRIQTQDIIRFLTIYPPLNKGVAWKTLCADNAERQKLTPQQLIENRRFRAKRYYEAARAARRQYQNEWRRRKRAATRLPLMEKYK